MIGMFLSATPLASILKYAAWMCKHWNMLMECVAQHQLTNSHVVWRHTEKRVKKICMFRRRRHHKQSWKDIDKRQDNPNPLVFLFGIQFYVRWAETMSACRIPIFDIVHSLVYIEQCELCGCGRRISICAMRPYAMEVAQCWVAINPCIWTMNGMTCLYTVAS